MRTLSIDTSTNYLSLALQIDGQIEATHIQANQKHADLILPQLDLLLNKMQVALNELDLIVYAQGPGSFTGLRIGVGIAQGLAFAHNIPLMGIPCLDVLASLAPSHEYVLCATDARMSEVFYAWYNTKTNERLGDYIVSKPENIQLLNESAMGIGNAFSVYENMPIVGQDKMPTAQDYFALVQTGRYPMVSAEHAELLYVRNKIALTAKEQAQRKTQI